MKATPARLAMLALMTLTSCGPTAEELSRKAATADAAARLRAQQATASRIARVEAEAKSLAKATAAEQARAEQEHLATMAPFVALGPKARIAEMRRICAPGDCARRTVMQIAKAAQTDRETKTLRQLAEKLISADNDFWVADAGKERAAERKAYAQAYELRLLNQHRNPDGVRTTGTNNTTLLVDGWFCSNQFLHDFNADVGKEVRKLGFLKVQCESGLAQWSQEL